jgi:hypothetical protein
MTKLKDDRLRVPLDNPYANSLGWALFCFARLEWDIVWCCEKIKPGYINGLGKKTAGNIAKDFVKLGRTLDPNRWAIASPIAQEFSGLVETRNRIMHGKSGSNQAGEQRLFHGGLEWTIAKIDDAADDITACQIKANNFLHKHL